MGESQLGWDFSVIPSYIIVINAYMLLFINILAEVTRIPNIQANSGKVNFRNFSGNSGYCSPKPSRSSSERSKQ